MKEAAKRGLVWRPDHAAYVIRFFHEYLRHSKGEWAGELLTLAPWQQFEIAVMFGWRRVNGTRRFRTWYEEVARKNGKSTKLAGIGLFLFAFDGEPGAEVYTAATKLDQAKITHAEAEMMVRQSPHLRRVITEHKNKLFIRGTANKFVPLGADAKTQDGLNIHGAIIDEFHAHPTRALWDVLISAIGSRLNPLIWTITTSGFNQEGSICLEQRGYTVQVLEGAIDDDSHGGVIYTLDADDDWRDERVWIKANPNLGVSVKLEALRDAARKASISTAALVNFLTKHLNVWTQQAESWLSLDDWDRGGAAFDPSLLEGRRCTGGLDLASTTDIAAWVLLFEPTVADPQWRVLARFFVPEDNIERRARKDRVPYTAWVKSGWLTATPGNVIDQEAIKQQILRDAAQFELGEVGYDVWNAAKIAVELLEEGVNAVPISQNFAHLTAPSKELEGLVLSARLGHGGNPVLRWMAGNVVLLRDTNDNYRPNKRRSRERIDGIVALIMALNRGMVKVPDGTSVYEQGIRI